MKVDIQHIKLYLYTKIDKKKRVLFFHFDYTLRGTHNVTAQKNNDFWELTKNLLYRSRIKIFEKKKIKSF